MRSRTDCIMVLPVRNSRVKNTAPRIARRTKPTSPNCLMNAIVKSFAGCVFVSFGEFANRASILADTAVGLRGIVDALLVPSDLAFAEAAPLVEQLVMEQDGGGLLAGRVGSLASKVPTMSKVQLSEPSALFVQIVEWSGNLSPIFQPNFFMSATFTIAPARALRNAVI